MLPQLLGSAHFWDLLVSMDADLACAARGSMCPRCGGPLNQANFWRKPRGSEQLAAAHRLRHSLCCARDGCRKRVTPVSVRFLGRKLYFGALIVVVGVLTQGATPRRCRELRAMVGVDRRTVERWRRWWIERFAKSAFLRSVSGHFARPVDDGCLPASLLEQFSGHDLEPLTKMLRFLAPITSGSAPGCMPI